MSDQYEIGVFNLCLRSFQIHMQFWELSQEYPEQTAGDDINKNYFQRFHNKGVPGPRFQK